MSVPFSNTKLRVPKGFQNILEALAREVLRVQPDNIYVFGAAYFEELLKMRKETGNDDVALLGAKLEDRFYNNNAFKNTESNTNNAEEQQDAAVKIQSEYRRYTAKKDVHNKMEDEAATKIQASFRGHMERQKIKNQDGDDVEEDSKETENEDVISTEVMKDSAEKTEVGETLQEDVKETEESDVQESNVNKEDKEVAEIDLEDPDLNKAAVKIQSSFKGYQTRKSVRKTTDDAEVVEKMQNESEEQKVDEVPGDNEEQLVKEDNEKPVPDEEPKKEEETTVKEEDDKETEEKQE